MQLKKLVLLPAALLLSGELAVWAQGAAPILTLQHSDPVKAVTFSSDGTTVATASGNTVQLWNAQTGQLKRAIQGGDQLARADRGRDAIDAIGLFRDTLAVGNRDGTITLWDVQTGKLLSTLKDHEDGVRSLTLLGKTLVSESLAEDASRRSRAFDGSSYTARIVVRDLETGTLAKTLSVGAPPLCFSPDGSTMALASGKDVILWDMHQRMEKRTLPNAANPEGPGGFARVFAAAFSPDGKMLASAGNGIAKLWEVESGKLRHSLSVGALVDSLAFSPDGRALATGSSDGAVRLGDVPSGRLRQVLTYVSQEDKREWREGVSGARTNLEVRTLSFSPNGKLLACGGTQNTAKIWQLSDVLSEPMH